MEVVLLAGLILVNSMFAMSEIALVTARRSKLALLAEAGDPAATAAIRLGEDPTRFLSTIQIGITSIGILSGIVGEGALAEPLSVWMRSMGIEGKLSSILSTGFVVVVITYFSIVIGELVPKRLGQIHPEGIARVVARPMEVLAMMARPFVVLLTKSTDHILRLLGTENSTSSAVTEEEIHALLAEGSEAGVIEQSEHEMVRNVFRLDDRQVNSMMIPRGEIVWLEATSTICVPEARKCSSSAIPVRVSGTKTLGWMSLLRSIRPPFNTCTSSCFAVMMPRTLSRPPRHTG